MCVFVRVCVCVSVYVRLRVYKGQTFFMRDTIRGLVEVPLISITVFTCCVIVYVYMNELKYTRAVNFCVLIYNLPLISGRFVFFCVLLWHANQRTNKSRAGEVLLQRILLCLFGIYKQK